MVEPAPKVSRPRGRPRKVVPPVEEPSVQAAQVAQAVVEEAPAAAALPVAVPPPVPELLSESMEPVEATEALAASEPADLAVSAFRPVEPFIHPKPKHTYGYLASKNLVDLRKIGCIT